jgi:hypothetical protein
MTGKRKVFVFREAASVQVFLLNAPSVAGPWGDWVEDEEQALGLLRQASVSRSALRKEWMMPLTKRALR